MPKGPGKYDPILTKAKNEAGAISAALIVADGIHGSGFALQGTGEFLLRLPGVLRYMADQIERENAEGFENEVVMETRTTTRHQKDESNDRNIF